MQITHPRQFDHHDAFLMRLPLWCEAANCTLVTSSLRLVDKRSRSWLQRSFAQLRGVTCTTVKRRGFVKKDGSAAVDDSTLDIFSRIRLVKFDGCFTSSLLFSALTVLIIASGCAK